MIDTHTHTIGFKIASKPYAALADQSIGKALLMPHAFSLMLGDVVRAALAGNVSSNNEKAVIVAMLPTGFFGKVNVLNLPDGLLAIRSLMDRYHLSAACGIFTKSALEGIFIHFCGPDNGCFEAELNSARQLAEVLRKQLPPPKTPAP